MDFGRFLKRKTASPYVFLNVCLARLRHVTWNLRMLDLFYYVYCAFIYYRNKKYIIDINKN